MHPNRTDQPIWGLCRQQGNDMRKFAMEFSGVAEGLGYNEAALKDLFNSALDEPLSWWRMRGQDHLMLGEFVEFLARSPAKVAGVPQVVGDEAAAPPVAADEAAVSLVAADKAAAHPGNGTQAGRSTHEVGAGSWHSKTVSSQGGGARSRAHSVPWAHRVRTRARSVLGAHRVRSWNRSSQVVNVCSTPGGILLCWPCLGLLPCRPRPGLLFCQPRPGTRVCLFLQALFHSTGLAHLPPRHFSVLVCVWSVWDPLLKGGVVSRSCWCARAGHQMSLCVEHMVCCLLLVPCAPMSTVCPLPSCYLIIVWVVPPVSPSLPSFVSLFSLLVSVVLYWSVVFRRVCYVDCATVLCLPACFFPFGLVFVYFVIKSSFYCVWVLASSLSSRILKLYGSKLSIFLLCQKSLGH